MEGEPLPPVDDSEQLPARPMAEKGTGSAREHGGQPPALPGDPRVPDCEDTAVEPMEVSIADQSGHLRPAHPSRRELKSSDDSVLTRSK
jgi:hypothetical protein